MFPGTDRRIRNTNCYTRQTSIAIYDDDDDPPKKILETIRTARRDDDNEDRKVESDLRDDDVPHPTMWVDEDIVVAHLSDCSHGVSDEAVEIVNICSLHD